MTLSQSEQAFYGRQSKRNVVVAEDHEGCYLASCKKCKVAESFGIVLQTAIDPDVDGFCTKHRHETSRWTWDLVKKVYL